MRSTAGERLAGAAYALGWAAVRWVPERPALAVFRLIADVAWRRRGKGVRQLEANLARVVGPDADGNGLRRLSRAVMRSYSRYWLEVFRLPAMGSERILSGMRIQGVEDVFANLRAGRGVVLALPHMGNYDHAGAWIVLSGAPFTTVVQRLRPESLFDRFVAFRESLGMEVIALTGGERDVFGQLARRLRSGGLVCLVADRDITASGVEVEFFGEPARMPAGPALLAMQTGAALMPVTLWYEGDCWGVRVHEEVPVPAEGDRKQKVAAVTQALARVFEAGIAEHPQNWHMLQRLWLADLDERVPKGAGAAE
ncbi:MAG: phosphatidylinositol mannoside acyltransferase [Streptosporangiales bacterium]|nr:phosphatidylinositol mannoside acyltransferase [Streptosporangiales bacterium]